MTKEPTTIVTIVDEELIKVSEKPEKGHPNGGSHKYVSLMRSLDKAGRNPNKWVYGVQLDGTRLSDRYKITPFSMAATGFKGSGNTFRVKTLTSYDDGTYTLSLINRPTFKIPKYVYDEIEYAIVNDLDGNNDKKHLTVSPGVRRYMGRMIITKYNYGTESGGVRLNQNSLSNEALTYLAKHTMMNETEERIWILDTTSQYINIKGLITGYIEPTGDDTLEEYIKDGLLPKKNIFHY